MSKFGIFEKIYMHDYNVRFRQLEIVRLEENGHFFSYLNNKTYPVNHAKTIGEAEIGKVINSHFFDMDSYQIKEEEKVYDLYPGSIVFSDCESLLSRLITEKELQFIKSQFGFLFEEANPPIEEIKKCQTFFDKKYNQKFKKEEYKNIFASENEYEFIKSPQTGWYVIDFSQEK